MNCTTKITAVATMTLLLSCVIATQSGLGQSTETKPTFSATYDKTVYQEAKETFSFTNDFTEPITIKKLKLKIVDFKVDKTPALLYHVSRLFDCLVVVVENVGWETYHGHTFSLFPEDATTSDGKHRLSDLFDLKSPTVPLKEVSDKALFTLRIGPKHVPFVLVSSNERKSRKRPLVPDSRPGSKGTIMSP